MGGVADTTVSIGLRVPGYHVMKEVPPFGASKAENVQVDHKYEWEKEMTLKKYLKILKCSPTWPSGPGLS